MNKEKFIRLLKANNLRDTVERRVIFDEIYSFPDTFSREDIDSRMEAERISRGTVVNTLNLFIELGIIKLVPSVYKHYVYEVIHTEINND
ncbi:MAG: transcriptional repressor [Prevotella sp.]|jgi:Fe2+ or Zn2+ uptake regulation protein|nr:transcriptional repressor [Prevotella sp.]